MGTLGCQDASSVNLIRSASFRKICGWFCRVPLRVICCGNQRYRAVEPKPRLPCSTFPTLAMLSGGSTVLSSQKCPVATADLLQAAKLIVENAAAHLIRCPRELRVIRIVLLVVLARILWSTSNSFSCGVIVAPGSPSTWPMRHARARQYWRLTNRCRAAGAGQGPGHR
jgi:hypothetical protein